MKPIFCLVGESGSGKSTYLDLITNQYKNIKELKYCTTRSKRYAEEDTYYFMTNDEYLNIAKDNLTTNEIIESRMYEKYDEKVYYFTLRKNLEVENCDALICAASVDQALSYRSVLDNVYIIDIKVDLKERLKRLIERTNTNDEILEVCRRTIEEQEEYSKLNKIEDNIIHIYNDNSKFEFPNQGNLLYALITTYNLKNIMEYINNHI